MNGRTVSWVIWGSLLALLLGLASAGIALTPKAARAADAAEWIELGRWREARVELERVVQEQPADARAHAMLARTLSQFGESKRAQEIAEKAVALDGKSTEARYALAEVLGVQAQKAGALRQLGLAKRFKREAETAASLDPRHIDSRLALVIFHCKAPGIAGGDRKKAASLVSEIAAIDPARGWLARARMARELGDTTALEAHYRRAVAAGSTYETRMALATHLAQPHRGKLDEAERIARESEKLEPGRKGPYTLLASVYASRRQSAELDAVLERAERAVPWTRLPHYQAARLTLDASGDLASAERWMRHYLGGEPGPGEPTVAQAHWRLGLILEKQGRREEALAELQLALKLNSDLTEARKDLKRLKP